MECEKRNVIAADLAAQPRNIAVIPVIHSMEVWILTQKWVRPRLCALVQKECPACTTTERVDMFLGSTWLSARDAEVCTQR